MFGLLNRTQICMDAENKLEAMNFLILSYKTKHAALCNQTPYHHATVSSPGC